MAVSDTTTRLDLQNILVATDFSDFSEAPLSFASALSRRYKSQLLLLHVISRDKWGFVSPDAVPISFHDRRRAIERRMAKLLRGERFRGISTGVLLREGELCDVLSNVVIRNEVDLVVIGTHGHLGFSKFVLGSKAEAVCKRIDCPILIIGPYASEAWDKRGMRNILFAINLTTTSSKAISSSEHLFRDRSEHELAHPTSAVCRHYDEVNELVLDESVYNLPHRPSMDAALVPKRTDFGRVANLFKLAAGSIIFLLNVDVRSPEGTYQRVRSCNVD